MSELFPRFSPRRTILQRIADDFAIETVTTLQELKKSVKILIKTL
jgi:hypothetical protein